MIELRYEVVFSLSISRMLARYTGAMAVDDVTNECGVLSWYKMNSW